MSLSQVTGAGHITVPIMEELVNEASYIYIYMYVYKYINIYVYIYIYIYIYILERVGNKGGGGWKRSVGLIM